MGRQKKRRAGPKDRRFFAPELWSSGQVFRGGGQRVLRCGHLWHMNQGGRSQAPRLRRGAENMVAGELVRQPMPQPQAGYAGRRRPGGRRRGLPHRHRLPGCSWSSLSVVPRRVEIEHLDEPPGLLGEWGDGNPDALDRTPSVDSARGGPSRPAGGQSAARPRPPGPSATGPAPDRDDHQARVKAPERSEGPEGLGLDAGALNFGHRPKAAGGSGDEGAGAYPPSVRRERSDRPKRAQRASERSEPGERLRRASASSFRSPDTPSLVFTRGHAPGRTIGAAVRLG